MSRPLFLVLASVALASFVAGVAVSRPAQAQTWTDATTAATVAVDALCLYPNEAGSAARAEIWAHGRKGDGGIGRSGSVVVPQLAGGALTDAQAAIARGRTAWINQQQ